ncbi:MULTISPECIES: SEC-C metal-binding domain-containing protein [Bacillus]|nr:MULTISPECIES: SEC-C metal-binding domain-containing protein [Bacillus]
MDIYDTCVCNSGKKYKFCCMSKEIELGIFFSLA